MVHEILHVGLTVSDLDRSVVFYRDILGLSFRGELLMEGAETDALFRCPGTRVRVGYLNGSSELHCPPLELLQFLDGHLCRVPSDLRKTCISEVCFSVDDLDRVYAHLQSYGVDCLSGPQEFDFRSSGFGRSKALYFRDPDGIILELMQVLD